MSDRTKRIIVGASLLAAGVVGTLIYLKLTTTLADDENPIRVRNKILNFESESPQSQWVRQNDGKWRLKKNKHASGVFEVNAFGSSDCVTSMQGTSVQVLFLQDDGTARTFTITTGDEEDTGPNPRKKEPLLDPGNAPMTADNNGYKKKLRVDADPQGHITQITVQPQSGDPVTCNFPAEPRVLVELCRGQCS